MTANRHIGTIRRARPDEAPALNALTGRSTLHWGYEPAFLDWEPEALLVTTGLIAGSPVYVYEEDARVLGYHALLEKPPHWYLDKLFVEPDRIGTGLGKALWLHAVATARDLGITELMLDADPNATPFYRAMGCTWLGEQATTWPGWNLQLFRFTIPAGGTS
jgi:GNAT superfamily N-acetyltransferase